MGREPEAASQESVKVGLSSSARLLPIFRKIITGWIDFLDE